MADTMGTGRVRDGRALLGGRGSYDRHSGGKER